MRATFALGPAALALLLATVGNALRAQADKALGQYLSSECVTCHLVAGQQGGIPSIAGWPETVFIAVMGEYRLKQRANPIMQTVAGRLSAEEIASLAAYFGSLPPAN